MKNNLKKIVHFGDIHVFRNKRFNEHEYLFNEFYKQIQEIKPDLIVCTGDVVDSKINISPEQVGLVINLFKRCLSVCDVVVIPGNHDLNLQNKSRKDILSTIFDFIYETNTENNLYYLTKSEFLTHPRFDNVTFASWSCIEDQISPFEKHKKQIKDFKDQYVIGLYHGAVKGCIADNGFALSSGIDVSEFNQCNLVLMSDIHMQQSFRNKEIVFSGAMLQTKDNEEPHGTYLLHTWNEKENKYEWEVQELINPYSTISIEIDENYQYKLPAGIHKDQLIKLVYERRSLEKSKIQEIRKELLKSFPNNKIEVKPKISSKKNTVKTEEEIKIEKSHSLEQILYKFLEKYQTDFDIKDLEHTFNKVKELDKKYNSQISNETEFEEGDYFIERLVINNLFSFGPEDNIIDNFSEEGIQGITGKNAIGKSSILKTIDFILYESLPKNTSSAKKILNKHNRSKEGFGELIINKQGRRFYLQRSILPKKKGDGVSFELTFNEIDEDNNIIQELNGEKKQETQKNINKYFGVEEMFQKLSLFSAQKKQTEFIDCKNSERLLLVGQFLGVHSFEQKNKLVSEDIKVDKKIYEEKVKEIEQEDTEEEIFQQIKSNTDFINEKQVEINGIKSEKEEQDNEKNDLQELINKSKAVTLQKYKKVSEIENSIISKKNQIDKNKTLADNKNNELQELDSKKKTCIDQLEDFNRELKSNIDQYTKKNTEFEKLCNQFVKDHEDEYDDYTSKNDSEVLKLEKKVAVLESTILKEEKQLNLDTCSNCGRDFTEEDKKKVRKQVTSLEEEKKECEDRISKLEKEDLEIEKEIKKIKDLKKVVLEFKSFKDSTEKNISKKEQELSNFELEVLKIDNKYMQYEKDILIFQDEIKKLEEEKIKSIEIEEQIEIAQRKVDKYAAQLQPINSKISELNQELIEKEKIISTKIQINKELGIRINKIKENKQKIDLLYENLFFLGVYKKVVNKDGLPLFLLKEKINEVNQEVNVIANQMFNFDLLFKIEEEAGELNLEFIYEGDEENNDVSLASGSETFIINLCIKVGLAQLSELPKLKTLMIDEGFDSLDKDNLDKLPSIINSLLSYYQNVVMISHLDELKDIYTNTINLQKSGKYTEVLN